MDPRLDPTTAYSWPAEKLQKGGQVKVNGTWHNLILVNVYKGDRVDLVYADGKRDMVYPYDTYMFAGGHQPCSGRDLFYLLRERPAQKGGSGRRRSTQGDSGRDDCQQRGGAEALAARP